MNLNDYEKLTPEEKNAFYYLSLVPSVRIQETLKKGSVTKFRELIKDIITKGAEATKLAMHLDQVGMNAILVFENDYKIPVTRKVLLKASCS